MLDKNITDEIEAVNGLGEVIGWQLGFDLDTLMPMKTKEAA